MKRKSIRAVDLFCGAGGTSSGLVNACKRLGIDLDLLAINHWPVAIETHSANHPAVEHLCANLDTVDPRKVVPGGRLDLLVASPECMHHSNARGGRPRSDQSRASAWHIVRWAEALYIPTILIENVREFMDWGPLGSDGHPLKSRRGETYQAFLNALRSLGYTVEDRILNAADYGAATARRRLFIVARRGNRKIRWPEATHSRQGGRTLFGDVPRWRAAREIIDWDLPGQSIFTRKRPLSENTLRRIYAGLRKFGSAAFVAAYHGAPEGVSRAHSVEEPMPTLDGSNRYGLVEPYLVHLRGTSTAASLNQPVPAITAQGNHFALCEPFLARLDHMRRGETRVHSVDDPMPTLTGKAALALIEPFVLPHRHGTSRDDDALSVNDPMPTVTAQSADMFLVEPYLVRFNGTGGPVSLDEPLPTQTGRDRFGIVIPGLDGYVLDVRFRMLQPHELAAAQGFPDDYQFAGNREERVRQIGNAVEVHQAEALFMALIGGG